MNGSDIIALLKTQLRQSGEREKSLLEQIDRQSVQITRLSFQLEQQAAEIKNLTAAIQSMEESMRLIMSLK